MDAVKAQFQKSDKTKTGKISEDSLADLIRKLCGDVVPLEMIYALFHSFDGGSSPRGTINYDDFIEWLFHSLEASGGGGSSLSSGLERSISHLKKVDSGKLDKVAETSLQTDVITPSTCTRYKLFCSQQHTAEAKRLRDLWLKGGVCDSVKASTPPFNTRLNVPLPDQCVALNVATFGVKLPRVIMKLFEPAEIVAVSSECTIPIPKYALDTFVQKKMSKVSDLVAEARKPEMGLDEADIAAVDKLEQFSIAFGKLDGKKISGPVEFQTFVEQYVNAGWEDHLHFDSVLVKNFGLSQAVSDKLRLTTIKVMDKDVESDVSLEHHALRWLTKAFKGYGPVGCLTDLVNLVYCMLHMTQPAEASEADAMAAVSKFQEMLDQQRLNELWLPTHLAHDAETDDCLCWLLLTRLHQMQGTELEVLIQLPAEEKCHDIADCLREHKGNIQIFRDEDSSNGKAVGATWGPLAAKFKENKDKN